MTYIKQTADPMRPHVRCSPCIDREHPGPWQTRVRRLEGSGWKYEHPGPWLAGRRKYPFLASGHHCHVCGASG